MRSPVWRKDGLIKWIPNKRGDVASSPVSPAGAGETTEGRGSVSHGQGVVAAAQMGTPWTQQYSLAAPSTSLTFGRW